MRFFKIKAVWILPLILIAVGCSRQTVLNDFHSRLNSTSIAAFEQPESTEDLVRIVKKAKKKHRAISISGGRHAMGGQQFGEKTTHISMKKMNRVIRLDPNTGVIRVQAGIEWPALIDYLLKNQKPEDTQWSIVQKQTGADNLSIGGALSANIHGRGLHFKPFVQDVIGFTLVNANGEVLQVSRAENPELFRLVIGGYGLFGVIAEVDLKLQKRFKMKRRVEVISTSELPAKARQRLAEGHAYGDFQYKTDASADDFMGKGVLSSYYPIADDTVMPIGQRRLKAEDWAQLILLAHRDKTKAFQKYSDYYLTTDGQLYWSDTSQMSFYSDAYIELVNAGLPESQKSSLMITEIYVPFEKLNDFIEKVKFDTKKYNVDVIYGTMRLIKKDDETFLPYAKQDYAAIIFNLRVVHTSIGMEKAKEDFVRLIDRGLEFGGSYFLTYHRWARKDQVLAAYPQFVDFLKLKLKYDPEERFQSEWYRHYKNLFQDELTSK